MNIKKRLRNKKGMFINDDNKKISLNCLYCDNEFISYKHELRKFCSLKCYRKNLVGKAFVGTHFSGKGKDNYFWNGGVSYQSAGYKMIWKPEHPNSNIRGYVCEHRLIMEKKLKRYLLKTEVVHHIDNDVSNNNIENLMLFPDNTTHMKHHFNKRRKK